MQNNILFVILQDVHDWKEPGVDRLPLPEKAAKARAILARTNASTINAYEHVCNNDIVFWQATVAESMFIFVRSH
jgi:hypothetical protein